MPRPPKLRKKNGYWMTRAGGNDKYFGRVGEVSYEDARGAFSDHLKQIGNQPNRRTGVTCLEVCDRHLEWIQKYRSEALYKQRKHFLERWCAFEVGRGSHRAAVGDLPYTRVRQGELESWLDQLQSGGFDFAPLSAVLALRDLSDTEVTDAGLVHLTGLNDLEYLYLDGTPVTDRGLMHLKRLKRLRHLSADEVDVMAVERTRAQLQE